MDKVTVEGKEYVKAASIARELGYTRDYIGQLCRAKKIEAQLVGRSWYVHVPSLELHKKQRYQTSQVEQKNAPEMKLEVTPIAPESVEVDVTSKPAVNEEVKKEAAAELDEAKKKSNKAKDDMNYEKRLALLSSPKYYTDEGDLFPSVLGPRQAEHIEEPVEIKIKETKQEEPEDYYVEVIEESKPLRGSLSVIDLAQPELSKSKTEVNKEKVDDGAAHVSVGKGVFPEHKKQAEKLAEAESKPENKAFSATKIKASESKAVKKETKDPKRISFEERLLTGPQPLDNFPELQPKQTLKKPANSKIKLEISPLMASSVIAGLTFLVLALGLSWQINFEGNEFESGYRFDLASAFVSQQH